MTTEYPLRPNEIDDRGIVEQVCQCGHNCHQHTTSNQMLTSYPPQFTYLECEVCMCPKYRFEKEYKIHLTI